MEDQGAKTGGEKTQAKKKQLAAQKFPDTHSE
jgi:hypothetical protein